MAASAERRPRRGPAPIASFDHDVSDESSPENKQAIRLPEIREDPSCSSTNVACGGGDSLAPPEQRARSHSSPAVHAAVAPTAPSIAPPSAGLQTPAAPRIDISRASSSSHHDSRDSSPELALFAGTCVGAGEDARARLELGFREDGTLDLRSSTEELAFLEGAPGGPEPRPPPPAPPSRRHSRKDSQGSEAALLGVSGRTSRLSSVGSQCSAHSALSAFSHASRVSRLSVVSGASRSPSPHKMLLETSFCGPKPIETDPEICAAAVEERLLEIAQLVTEPPASAPVDARDRREVRTEVTVESTRPASAPRLVSPGAPPPTPTPTPAPAPIPAPATATAPSPSCASLDEDKRLKETRNQAKVEERRARSRDRRDPSQPEVYKQGNQSKNIIRIKLKPDDEYDNNDNDDESDQAVLSSEPSAARKPATLELSVRPAPVSPPRTPSPSAVGAPVSRKSSFCSLFKSKETIASPDSPSDALRRKKSLNEGRSRSKSRDRSATPTSAGKIKGSVLSLFKTPRRSGASPSPSSRDASPVIQPQRQFPQTPVDRSRGEKLKYYEEAKNGIIHIPLRTPPDEIRSKDESCERLRDAPRPASAPQPRIPLEQQPVVNSTPLTSAPKPTQRTVLPDGSIIIPLHSPTEKTAGVTIPSTSKCEQASVSESPRIAETEVICAPVEFFNSMDSAAEQNRDSAPDVSPPADPATSGPAGDQPRRKERIIFTTHVGSKEQVFSTQFSITKTPSVTSEISESIPSFPESEEIRPFEPPRPSSRAMSRHDAIDDEPLGDAEIGGETVPPEREAREASSSPALDPGRDSSGSEASSEAATRGGSDAERRGLVVQESFEELPYVPTTLPLERSLALPMVPVRDRGGVRVSALQRPRAAAPRPPSAPLPTLPSPSALPSPANDVERLHIRLPRRARTASIASAAGVAPPPRAERARSRSGGDATAEARGKGDWIDFSEVPERRKQPKRIQTLPTAARDAVVFSYVPPERCRCECHAHAHAHAPPDDELPLLLQRAAGSASSPEGEEADAHDAPFTADLDLRHNHTEAARPR